MKKLVLALCMLPSIAAAEFLPNGCYVAFNNPDYCWQPIDGKVEWLASTDRTFLMAKHGHIEALIYDWYQWKSLVGLYKEELDRATAACSANFNALLAQRDALSAQYSTLVDQYNGLVTPYNKNLALIKKLRRACGTKCKKIK